jgi:hypothetical protein
MDGAAKSRNGGQDTQSQLNLSFDLTPSNLDIFTIILIMFAFQDPTQKQQ